jgi:iron complex outermembrane receptor protein
MQTWVQSMVEGMMVSLRASAALSALAVSLALCPAASAQLAASTQEATAPTVPDTTDPSEGEIIVTANKRAENVQKVPLAVSVISPVQLATAGVRNFTDIGKISPSLVVRPAEQPQNSNISLRGVGTFAFGVGVESSVAVLVDEVPLPFQARAFTDLPDIQRIEVLRGPQSTLYGKSASAGLVNLITRDPTATFQGRANAVMTNDRERGLNFSLSGPVTPDLGFIFSAAYNQWDGNVRNLFNGKRVNGREAINVRGKLRWDPTDDASLVLSGNYVNGSTTVGRPFIRMSPNALLRGTPGLTPAVVLPGVTIDADNQDISNNFNSRTDYEGGGGYLRGELALGSMNLTTITSYDRFHMNDVLDHDDTSAPGNLGNNTQVGKFDSTQWTDEVRLQSPSDNAFRYTIGGYAAFVRISRPIKRGPYFALADWFGVQTSRQFAGFVQADWSILPQLVATGGARLQNERVAFFYDDFRTNTQYSDSTSDTAATYRASLRYEFTPDINVFATYATGYKGQTFDLTTGFNRNRLLAGPIRPERSRDKELGIRSQFFDRRLTMNVTLFDTNYRDLQAQTIEFLPDGSFNYRLTNVGRITTKGVEVESTARIGDDLNLNGGLTYLDAKYNQFDAAQCYPLQTAAQGCTGTPARQNLSGTTAIQAPKWKFNIGGDFSPALTSDLRAVVQGNWQYQSSIYFQPRDPQTFQPAYSIVNVGLGVREEDRRWEVVAFVNNLFDKQYYGSLVNTASNFGLNVATQAVLPRDFRRYAGVRASFNF